MPVDLSCIPARAKRRATPSLKRWLIYVMLFVGIGGFITANFWPASVPTNTSVFWICFLGIPTAGGLIILSIRWLVYLASEWLADGWDAAREQDLAQDIRNGQRSLALLGYVVHLPHVISAESISQQLLMPEGIALPSQIEETGELLIHNASFSDVASPIEERAKERIRVLLTDTSLQNSFQRLPEHASLTVLFQLSPDLSFASEECHALQKFVKERIDFPVDMTFVNGEGFQAVDTWLDSTEMMQNILVIALNIKERIVDGVGEGAVALLLSSPETSKVVQHVVAQIHRPEQVKVAQELKSALWQALQWGKCTSEEIKNVWLTGTGASNKASSLLSTSGVLFPAAGQPCDIDLKAGLTGTVSPWLAIAVAADQAGQSKSPQLVMFACDDNTPPWFITVCPATKLASLY